MRRTILSHRDGARVFAGAIAADPASLDVIEAVLDAWQETGLTIDEAAQRAALLRHFIVGFCIEAQAMADLRSESGLGQLEELKKSTDPARFPLAAQALPILLGTTADDHFELGLRLMLSDLSAAADDR